MRALAAAALAAGLLASAPAAAAGQRVDSELIEEAAHQLAAEASPALDAGEIHVDPFFTGAISEEDRALIARAEREARGAVRVIVLPPYAGADIAESDVDMSLTAEVVDRAGRELLGDGAADGDMVVFLIARGGIDGRISVQTPSGIRAEDVRGHHQSLAFSAGPIGHRAIRVADALSRGETPPPITEDEAAAGRIDPKIAGLTAEHSMTRRGIELGATISGILVLVFVVVRATGLRRSQREPRLAAQRLKEYETAARRADRSIRSGDAPLHRAAARLPHPGDAAPEVQAAWVVLEREARGEESDFFDPVRAATTRRWVDALGAEVPVSSASVRELDAGRLPPTLRDARGRPYWRDDETPFARSGYGAFAPLTETLLEGEDSGPLEEPRNRPRRSSGSWAAGPALIAALVIGTVGGGLAGHQLALRDASDYLRTTPAHQRIDLPSAFSPEAVELVRTGVEEDGYYLHPSLFAAIDEGERERLREILVDSSAGLALVAIPTVGSDQPYHLDAVQSLVPSRPVLELSSYGRLRLELPAGVRSDDLEAQFAVEDEVASLGLVESVQRWTDYLDATVLEEPRSPMDRSVTEEEPPVVVAKASASFFGALAGSFGAVFAGAFVLGVLQTRLLRTPAKRTERTSS